MEDIKPTRVNLRFRQTGPSCGHTYLSQGIRVQTGRGRVCEWVGGGVMKVKGRRYQSGRERGGKREVK